MIRRALYYLAEALVAFGLITGPVWLSWIACGLAAFGTCNP